MNTYFVLTTIAMAVLTIYTASLCLAEKQIPSSLSASVFYLPRAGAVVWLAVICIVVFCLAPVLIAVSSPNTQFLAFIACAGLLFVGGCPLVKDKTDMTYHIHMAGAITCAISANLLIIFNHWWLMFLWIPWLFWFVWVTKDRRWTTQTFWAEMTCFYATFAYAYIGIASQG